MRTEGTRNNFINTTLYDKSCVRRMLRQKQNEHLVAADADSGGCHFYSIPLL